MNKISTEIIIDTLRVKWSEQKPEDNKFRYKVVFHNHPYEWYLGWDTSHHKELVFISNYSAKLKTNKFSSQLLGCTEKKMNGKFNLYFTLLDDTVFEEYLVLCKDLIQVSAEETSEQDALRSILERFRHWKAMLERKSNSADEFKGVLGELMMIKELVDQGFEVKEVLNSWSGPEYLEQDFSFPNTWFEVKAVGSNAMIVKISSAGQLDHPGEGWLYVFGIDSADPTDNDSTSVKSFSEKLKNTIMNNDVEARTLFDDKLSQYGYSGMCLDDFYWFKLSSLRKYLIENDFPRLSHDIKRSEMKSIRYDLILSAIEPWRK